MYTSPANINPREYLSPNNNLLRVRRHLIRFDMFQNYSKKNGTRWRCEKMKNNKTLFHYIHSKVTPPFIFLNFIYVYI